MVRVKTKEKNKTKTKITQSIKQTKNLQSYLYVLFLLFNFLKGTTNFLAAETETNALSSGTFIGIFANVLQRTPHYLQ